MADLLHRVDKPEGWTSHDAVARMRAVLGTARVGHAGTLDPFASGLLLVGEGRATALLGPLALLPKRYRARARLGVTTDTQDLTGAVTGTSGRIPEAGEVAAALSRFRGTLDQTPPLFSAVKVKGKRLYEAARKGLDVERPARQVRVYDLTLEDAALPEITLEATVSRGTYMRTLAHDLGEALGCGAHLTALRRIGSGPFHVEQALSCGREAGLPASAFREHALTPASALGFLPRVHLTEKEAARLRHGRAPVLGPERIEEAEPLWPLPPGERGWPIALLESDGSLLALARPWEDDTAGAPVPLLRVLVGT